jgi:hypothetical protein
MLRALVLRSAVLALVWGVVLLGNARSQSLPSLRLDLEGDGCVCYLFIYGELVWTGDIWFFEPTSSDFDDVLAYAPITDSLDNEDVGRVDGMISAEATINTATNASDFAPAADTSVQTLSDNEVYSGGMGTFSATLDSWIWCSARGTFEIQEHPSHPGAGTDPNSATITEYLWLVISGDITSGTASIGDFGDGDHALYAQVGNSWVGVDPLNESGTITWEAEGTLHTSDSSDPTSLPLIIDQDFIDGMNYLWVGTEATQVGAQFDVIAFVTVNSYIQADDKASTPEFGMTALDQMSYKASAWYEVDVP